MTIFLDDKISLGISDLNAFTNLSIAFGNGFNKFLYRLVASFADLVTMPCYDVKQTISFILSSLWVLSVFSKTKTDRSCLQPITFTDFSVIHGSVTCLYKRLAPFIFFARNLFRRIGFFRKVLLI